jgi:hypothetical protein
MRMVLARILNAWLRELTALQRPFPISIRARGIEEILDACANPNGMVLCSFHLPLIHLALRPLVDIGRPQTAVVSGEEGLTNSKFPVPGLGDGLPAVVFDSHVLFKVRRILHQGGLIAALVDTGPFGDIRLNIFRLIRSVGAQLVFTVVGLDPDGEILVEYFAPPDPFCRSDESISANLQALKNRVDQVLEYPCQRGNTPALPIGEITSANVAAVKLSNLDSSS